MARFKTRARTVEMLGRQQIANASTAVNELIKNAYDAYAERICIDYICADEILAIRDDGVGMTPEEFENRWLVLGTDSKIFESNTEKRTYKPVNIDSRVMMGEKGIGRLAIGLLGRQVLILTRANRGENKFDLLMCLIHWGVFEIPGLNLEEIEFPTHLVKNGNLPTRDEIDELVRELSNMVRKLPIDKNEPVLKSILDDIETVKLDPKVFSTKYGGPNLTNWNAGTQFYIFTPSEEIYQEIELERIKETKDFSKALLGFSNTVFCGEKKPVLETEFRYWPKEGEERNLISEKEFFTSSELYSADHRIEGHVDEYGQFNGKVRVYNEEFPDHVISWPDGKGQKTNCGPFDIEFGYIAGEPRSSTLPHEDWARMNSKLNKIGGLYIYRNNIRILPYGNSDFDWLKIEERRSKSAGNYFFSYRRIFGAVILTRERNKKLREKAGREGFQQDKAYRQFKEILINLFLQLAADFFRRDGENSYIFNKQKDDLNRLDVARRKRERQVGEKRKQLELSLENYFDSVSNNKVESELESLQVEYQNKMTEAITNYEPKEALIAVSELECDALEKLEKIRESYEVSKPIGVGLRRSVRRDWMLYEKEFEKLNKEVFNPFALRVSEFASELTNQTGATTYDYKLTTNRIDRLCEKYRKSVQKEITNFSKLKNSVSDFLQDSVKISKNEFDKAIATIKDEIKNMNSKKLSAIEFNNLVIQFEDKINYEGNNILNILKYSGKVLDKMSKNLNEEFEIVGADEIEAMDQELLDLREQVDADAEMVQLGNAIAVINHEFVNTINSVRQSLRKLEKYVEKDSNLKDINKEILENFEQLNGQLSLFTPLQRRRNPKRSSISGRKINYYVHTLLKHRLKKCDISLNVTDEFLNASVDSFPSTIYPVFINIVDNAIYWLMEVEGPKVITFDATESSFSIRNNGPAIKDRDHENIFEQGFTRKPTGRGLGLYISKKVLDKDDLSISIEPNTGTFGVTFKISWENRNEENA